MLSKTFDRDSVAALGPAFDVLMKLNAVAGASLVAL
jgi:hypothetical protein